MALNVLALKIRWLGLLYTVLGLLYLLLPGESGILMSVVAWFAVPAGLLWPLGAAPGKLDGRAKYLFAVAFPVLSALFIIARGWMSR